MLRAGERFLLHRLHANDKDRWVEPTTVVVKPPEQLDLTEKELNTEITRILSAKDPMAPHNITRYRRDPPLLCF